VSYTTLRVEEAGVVLYDYHLRRLGRDHAEFERFARGAAPGVYSISTGDGGFRSTRLAGSRLREGMPVRYRVSPVADRPGPFAKPAPPSEYDSVRQADVVTLLTSASGTELYEACVAALIGWDGSRFVCVPQDRPRVASVTEAAVREAFVTREAPLSRDEKLPLILVNAVKGPCRVDIPGRERFPDDAVSRLRQLLRSLTYRP